MDIKSRNDKVLLYKKMLFCNQLLDGNLSAIRILNFIFFFTLEIQVFTEDTNQCPLVK